MTEQKWHYTACGLDGIYLLNGFEVVTSPRGRMVRIHNQPGLHRAIGEMLVRQKRSLTGNELKFLRHELGLSQTNLAVWLGENEQSVARREKRKTRWKRPTPQERLIRFLYEEQLGGNERLSEFLKSLAELDDTDNYTMTFEKTEDASSSWHRAEERQAA